MNSKISETKPDKEQKHKPQPKPREKKINLSSAEFKALKKKEEKAHEYYERLLRQQADFENYRKRMLREKEEFAKFANGELIAEFLPVVDNLERALDGLDNSPPAGPLHSLKEGLGLIQKQLLSILKKSGVEEIESVGKKFDPNYHEVVMQVESSVYPEDVVVEEIQKGYILHQRLIRPAVVKVATGGKKLTEEKGGH